MQVMAEAPLLVAETNQKFESKSQLIKVTILNLFIVYLKFVSRLMKFYRKVPSVHC